MNSVNKNNVLEYSGDIKLSTYIGRKLVSQKKYHNAGALSLYRFFAYCLTGDFNKASKFRPYKIKLFKYSGDRVEDFDLNIALNTKQLTSVTEFINITAAPEILYSNDTSKNEVGCQVKLSFMFPYTKLFGNEANVIAIYGVNIADNDSLCAYYLLTKEIAEVDLQGIDIADDVESAKTIVTWDPIIKAADEEELNRVIAVEWTMTLKNKLM
jgi:hypothetical protein